MISSEKKTNILSFDLNEYEITGFDGSILSEAVCNISFTLLRNKISGCYFVYRHRRNDDNNAVISDDIYTEAQINEFLYENRITLIDSRLPAIDIGVAVYIRRYLFVQAEIDYRDSTEDIRWVENDPRLPADIVVGFGNEEKITHLLDRCADRLMVIGQNALKAYFVDTVSLSELDRSENCFKLALSCAIRKTLRASISMRLALSILHSSKPERLDKWHQLICLREFPDWTIDKFLVDVNALRFKFIDQIRTELYEKNMKDSVDKYVSEFNRDITRLKKEYINILKNFTNILYENLNSDIYSSRFESNSSSVEINVQSSNLMKNHNEVSSYLEEISRKQGS